METLPSQLPALLRDALDAHGGSPLEVVDLETQRVYLVFEQGSAPTLDDEFVRSRLREAEEDIASGAVGPWDAERVKQEGRRILAQRRGERAE